MKLEILTRRPATAQEVQRIKDLYNLMNADDPNYAEHEIMFCDYYEAVFPSGKKIRFFCNLILVELNDDHVEYVSVAVRLADNGSLIPQAEDYICGCDLEAHKKTDIN